MTPLQKIAMGMVVVLVPANFPRDPRPLTGASTTRWPTRWAGCWSSPASGRSRAPSTSTWPGGWPCSPSWSACRCGSRRISHHLLPHQGAGAEPSDLEVTPYQWFASLPHIGFCLALVRSIGRDALAQSPRDRFVAGRFGVLTWGFVAAAVLPAVAFGGRVAGLQAPSLLLLALVDLVFVYYLFRVHRRMLGGRARAGRAR